MKLSRHEIELVKQRCRMLRWSIKNAVPRHGIGPSIQHIQNRAWLKLLRRLLRDQERGDGMADRYDVGTNMNDVSKLLKQVNDLNNLVNYLKERLKTQEQRTNGKQHVIQEILRIFDLPMPEKTHLAIGIIRDKYHALKSRCIALSRGIDPCTVCAGVGKPVSGGTCVCGGTGYGIDEKQGLRQGLYDLRKKLDAVENVLK